MLKSSEVKFGDAVYCIVGGIIDVTIRGNKFPIEKLIVYEVNTNKSDRIQFKAKSTLDGHEWFFEKENQSTFKSMFEALEFILKNTNMKKQAAVVEINKLTSQVEKYDKIITKCNEDIKVEENIAIENNYKDLYESITNILKEPVNDENEKKRKTFTLKWAITNMNELVRCNNLLMNKKDELEKLCNDVENYINSVLIETIVVNKKVEEEEVTLEECLTELSTFFKFAKEICEDIACRKAISDVIKKKRK